MNETFDIVIVGGGIIGTLLALSLKNTSWRIALIEAHAPEGHQQATKDMRSIALNYSSQIFLEEIHLWNNLKIFATPIEKIHVSEKKRFGKTLLDAQALSLPSFGQVIPLPCLYQTLISHLDSTKLFRPATVSEIKKENHWLLKVNDTWIKTTLLIAADGERSFIRKTLNIPVQETHDNEFAIVSNAATTIFHQNTAYERFTQKGVLAVMPRENKRVGIIWTTKNPEIKNHLAEETQKAMGYRLGKFSDFAEPFVHPLKTLHANVQVKDNAILLGNAAHVLYPIAAQGLNLGIRDVSTLSQLISKSTNLEDPEMLKTYVTLREKDQHTTQAFSTHLHHLFTSSSLPLSLARSVGLGFLDLLPPLKRLFCLRQMRITS
jgi:2-octaprenyl-6-methoxyphenol hydroxylase